MVNIGKKRLLKNLDIFEFVGIKERFEEKETFLQEASEINN